MAAALVPPTKSGKCPSNLRNMPIDLRKMPIRPMKNAHPTYKKCPSDLKN